MEYALLVIAGLVVGLAGYYVSTRRRQTPRSTASSDNADKRSTSTHLSADAQIAKLRDTGKYWGYRIESHCQASSRLAGRQFTFDDTPPLPIPGCESRVCNCCMIGMPERRLHRDRRTGQDRRRTIRMDATDRRAERPRRQDDLNSWVAYSHL